jgi:hypothetical protein
MIVSPGAVLPGFPAVFTPRDKESAIFHRFFDFCAFSHWTAPGRMINIRSQIRADGRPELANRKEVNNGS